MKSAELQEAIQNFISPIVSQMGYDLVDVESAGSDRNRVVRIFVDKQGGIQLDDCARISRTISDEIDILDLIPGRYRLEVSSPGIDRPLRTARDFQRNLGREVTLHFRTPERDEAANAPVVGSIESVTDEVITLKTADGSQAVPAAAIDHGKVVLRF